MSPSSERRAPSEAAIQLKVSLLGVSKPPVWRRVLVPADLRLDRFHQAIQAAMGWSDSHLHGFTIEAGDYGGPDANSDDRDKRTARLGQFLHEPGDRIRYVYDFGDAWEHCIELESAKAFDPAGCELEQINRALAVGSALSG